jgi:endoglycosylceramidase
VSRLSIAVLVTCIAALAGCSSASSTGGTSKPTETSAALLPVHHVGTWIVDSEGRVVITHGFNMIWKSAPYYPRSFSADDAKFLASEGFSGARLGFIWAGAEPTPGGVDTTYLDQIARINHVLGQAGIRTLIDFHQDNYSVRYGGDGAPVWASIGNDSLQAFQNLWNDQRVGNAGLVQHFDAAWEAAARALGHSSNLIGLELLNEPYPGSETGCSLFMPCPSFEQNQLPVFYRQLIAFIRKVDPRTLLFYEPIPQLNVSPTALPAPLSDDSDLGFTFHYYDRYCADAPGPVIATEAGAQLRETSCTRNESAALDLGVAYAKRAGAAVDLGEFGDSTNPTDVANMVDSADQRFLNWTYWEYYTTTASLAPGLLINDHKSGSDANARQSLLKALVVPYPEAVNGTPVSYSLDRSNRVMHFAYDTAQVDPKLSCPTARTVISVPHRDYPDGYRVQVTGGKVLSPATWPWVEIVADHGARQVSVTLSRATGSTTQVPTAALDPKGNVSCASR